MRGLLGFLAGILIIALIAAGLLAGMRMFEYAGASGVGAVLMQDSNLRAGRVPAPVRLADMPDDYMRREMISKYAELYLRVIPNAGEPALRGSPRGALSLMSMQPVMEAWRRTVLPELRGLAADKKLRRVAADAGAIEKKGDYYIVPVTLWTWARANDLDADPDARNIEMLMKVRFNKRIRRTFGGEEFDAGAWLDDGRPPQAIFEFRVDEVIIK